MLIVIGHVFEHHHRCPRGSVQAHDCMHSSATTHSQGPVQLSQHQYSVSYSRLLCLRFGSVSAPTLLTAPAPVLNMFAPARCGRCPPGSVVMPDRFFSFFVLLEWHACRQHAWTSCMYRAADMFDGDGADQGGTRWMGSRSFLVLRVVTRPLCQRDAMCDI